MEINQAILRSLPIKFHEDDTYAYRRSLRKTDGDDNLKISSRLNLSLLEETPQKGKPKHRKGCPQAYSAPAAFSSNTDDYTQRLFASIRLSVSNVAF